jgi:hypothetical protein
MFVANIQHSYAARRLQLYELHHLPKVMFQINVYTVASVGAFLVYVFCSVQLRCNAMAYKRISSLGLSHDPSPYLAEIGLVRAL